MVDEMKTKWFRPSPEFSFLIGSFLGDGWKVKIKNRKSGYDYRIRFAVTDRDFAQSFSEAAKLVLNKKEVKIHTRLRKGRKPIYSITVSSKVLFEFFNLPLTEILKVALIYPIHFLRGFFDAEGYVAIDKKKNRKRIRIGVSNSNLELLEVIREVLNNLGIENRLETDTDREGYKKVWKVVISKKESLLKFKKIVNFTIKRKRKKLEKLRPFSGGRI